MTSIRMLSKKDQKYIKSLKIKKYRSREKRFLVEGSKNIQELLVSDFVIEKIVSTEQFSANVVGEGNDFEIEIANESMLAQLGTFKTNDAGIAIVKQKPNGTIKQSLSDHLFALDGVGDPGNLGTIIRTLDWFGYGQIVCSLDTAEFYHPKTIASTMGSFTRVNVVYADLKEFLESFDGKIFGADAGGEHIYDVSFDHPSIIVMGSESHGIREQLNQQINSRIAIPRVGKAESLNVGIATGIVAAYLRQS